MLFLLFISSQILNFSRVLFMALRQAWLQDIQGNWCLASDQLLPTFEL